MYDDVGVGEDDFCAWCNEQLEHGEDMYHDDCWAVIEGGHDDQGDDQGDEDGYPDYDPMTCPKCGVYAVDPYHTGDYRCGNCGVDLAAGTDDQGDDQGDEDRTTPTRARTPSMPASLPSESSSDAGWPHNTSADG